VARQEWLVYFIKTELFQNALELAVTDAEELAIKQVRLSLPWRVEITSFTIKRDPGPAWHKPVPGNKKSRFSRSTGVRASRARCSLIEKSDRIPVFFYRLERAYVEAHPLQ
jgi:hypothetical protein